MPSKRLSQLQKAFGSASVFVRLSDFQIRYWTMLLYGMREIFGQVTFTVAILIIAIAEICIALSANMRVHRALVMTFNLLPAFIAEEISVFTVTVGYLLIASIADMHTYGFVSAVDDSVTSVAIVIFVLIHVITNEFSAASGFVAVAVVVIVDAPDGNPYTAPVAYVVPLRVFVVGGVRICFAFCFLAADVAGSVLVFIHVIKALQLIAAFIAIPIAVGIRAYVGHPAATFITIVVTVPVCVIFAKLLHTVSGSVAILTSAVVGPVAAIVA